MPRPSAIKPVGASAKINMGLYGHPGAGKTRFIGSGGPKTLIVRPPTDHTDSILDSKAQEWVVRDWNDMNEVMEYLRHDGEEWDWVWLDSVSAFQDTGLDDVWQAAIDRKPDRAQFDVDKGEFGINMNRLSRWIRHVVGAAQFNFGFTAWPRELGWREDEDAEELLMPWVQGKNMAPKLCGYMNLVGYLEVKTKKKDGSEYRVLHTKMTDKWYAKDQFYAFGEDGKLINPTLPKVVSAIEARRPSNGAARKRRTTRTARKRRS